jgi:hypothetical protein
MMFMKGPGKPGQAPHQDEFFIPTRDTSLCASWIALDDVTVDNGGLWVIPGSHCHKTLYPMHPVRGITQYLSFIIIYCVYYTVKSYHAYHLAQRRLLRRHPNGLCLPLHGG